MAISLYTVTGNAADLLGANFAPKRIMIVVSTNLPSGEAPIDLENNRALLGGAVVWPSADGSFTIPNLIGFDSEDVNPSGIQYKIDLQYKDAGKRAPDLVSALWSTGWVSITADVDLADLVAEQHVPPTYMSGAVATLQELVDQASEITGLTGEDEAVAALVADSGSDTAGALSATIGGIVDTDVPPLIEARAVPLEHGETPALYDDFQIDTANGSAGTPVIGPGGAWSLSGGGAATCRVLGGALVSPAGVSYAYKLLGATPTYGRQRFIWRTGGSATFGWCNETTLSIPSVDMVHVSVTGTFISLTVWTNGASAVPANNGDATNGAVTLVNGAEYDMHMFVAGDVATATVTDVLTGTIMGIYTGSDGIVSDKVGALVYIEPNTGSDVTEVFVS